MKEEELEVERRGANEPGDGGGGSSGRYLALCSHVSRKRST